MKLILKPADTVMGAILFEQGDFMRTKSFPKMRLLSILAVLLLSSWLLPGWAHSEETVAVVQDLQGDVTAYQGSLMEIKKLEKGSKIELSSIVNTGGKSKLLLRWQQGLFASLGESSSISSAREGDTRQASRIQIIQGIARFSTDKSEGNPAFSYVVATPMVSIQSDPVDQPVDYMVEMSDSSSTILTILSGKVPVVYQTAGVPEESVYESCRTVNFVQGRKPEVVTASVDKLMKFVAQTTLANSLPLPDTCPGPIARETAPKWSAVAELRPYEPE